MPGKLHGLHGAWWTTVHGVAKELDKTAAKKKKRKKNKVTKSLLNVLVLLSVRVLQSNRIGERDRDTKRDSF